jgi:hypothetical protein
VHHVRQVPNLRLAANLRMFCATSGEMVQDLPALRDAVPPQMVQTLRLRGDLVRR